MTREEARTIARKIMTEHTNLVRNYERVLGTLGRRPDIEHMAKEETEIEIENALINAGNSK